MRRYVLRRLLHAVPTVLGAALLTFVLFHVFAPDPAYIALGQHASPTAVAELRRQWGLDQPLARQFAHFLTQIVTGDYGRSLRTGQPVMQELGDGALVSLTLMLPPFVAAGVLALSVAMASAHRREGPVDRATRAAATAAMSVSALVYVVVMQYALAYGLGLFPISGYEAGWRAVTYLALPWIILVLLSTGPDVRLYRSILLEASLADHVRTARSLGASERRILWRTILPNAWIPIITNNVSSIPFLLLGSFVLERWFSIPGLGTATIDALNAGDLPVLKAVTVCGAIALVGANIVTDVLYAVVDPRVRLE